MVNVATKSFWLSGWGVAPAPVVRIVANQYPMLYVNIDVATELISKVGNVAIKHVANDFPEYLIKLGKASELRSKWA